LSNSQRQEALVKQKEWDAKVKEYAQTKEDEIANEQKLRKEAQELSSAQSQIAKEFSPNKEVPEKDMLREKFDSCVKSNIIASFNAQKLKEIESKEIKNYINQLSNKLGELALYERITFFKSDSMATADWQELHKQALANPENYDDYYITLLKSVYQLKLLIEEKLKQKNIKIPTTAENNKCLMSIYKKLNYKLKQLEQMATQDSMPWSN
jgi:hypothetical protein